MCMGSGSRIKSRQSFFMKLVSCRNCMLTLPIEYAKQYYSMYVCPNCAKEINWKQYEFDQYLKSIMVKENKVEKDKLRYFKQYFAYVKGKVGHAYDGDYVSCDICKIVRVMYGYIIEPIKPSDNSAYMCITVKKQKVKELDDNVIAVFLA